MWRFAASLPGYRVGLRHPVEVGERTSQRKEGGALRLDEDDGVVHTEWVSPGARTTTSESVSDSTWDLNASASVSMGGKVS